VIVADAPALDLSTNDFSIETWIRPLSSVTAFGIMSVVSKRLAPDIIHSLGYDFALVDGQVTLRLSTSLAGDGQVWGRRAGLARWQVPSCHGQPGAQLAHGGLLLRGR